MFTRGSRRRAGLQQHVLEWARAWVTGGNIDWGELNSLREVDERVETTFFVHGLARGAERT